MSNRRSAVELQKAAEDAVTQEKREIVGVTLDINRSTAWKKVKVQKGCKLEVGKYPGIPCKVARISGCFKCSLETFVACMQNTENNASYDQGLRVNEVIAMTPSSKTSYVSYNSTTLIGARDFCLKTSDLQLAGKDIASILECFEGDQEGIGFDHSMIPDGGIPDAVFGHAIGSVNSEEAKPRENFIRGVIHAHGYIALSGWAQDGKSTLVINIIATDPKGNIPGFAFESTYPTYCDRLDRVRQLCESMERIGDETATAEEAENFQQEVSARASRVSMSRVVDDQRRIEESKDDDTERTASPPSDNEGLTTTERRVLAAFNEEDEKVANVEAGAADDASVFADVAPSPKQTPTESTPSKSEAPSIQDEAKATATEEPLKTDAEQQKKELTAKQQQLFKKLVDLHNRSDWKMGRVLQGCLLEEVAVPEFSKALKATRLSTEVKCSLETFFKFQSDVEKLRECDPTLDVYKILQSSDEVDTLYTSFKQLTRLIKPRDFCTDTAMTILDSDQALGLKLFGVEDGQKACIQASVDNTTARAAAPGYIRGSVFVYGCIAFMVDDSVDSTIKLFTVGLADPGGSIPKWLIDAAKEEGCKKLALTRKLLEEFQVELDRKKALEEKKPVSTISTTAQPKAAPKSASITESRSEEPSSPPPVVTADADSNSESRLSAANDENSNAQDDQAVAAFQEEEEQLEAFYTEEVDAIINPLTLSHRKARWESYNTINDLKVETAARLERKEDRIIRVYGDLMCSLEDFISSVTDETLLKKFDTSIESSSVLESPPYGTVRHVKHKSVSKGINTKHDTCSLTVYHLLTDHEGHTQHGLYSPTIRSAVYVVGSVDSKDMPIVKGYERFSVGVNGLIAIATPPEAARIRIFSLSTAKNTDVSKNKKSLEGYALAAAGKIAKMRSYFEEKRKAAKLAAASKPQASPSVPPPAVTSSVFTSSAGSDRYDDAQKIAIKLFNEPKWGPKRRVGSCEVAELSSANFGQVVIKVTREFMCSLPTLKQALDNVKSINRYDPTVQSYQLMDVERPENDALACSNLSLQFKSKSSKILGGKTICVAQSSRFYSQEEAIASGLYSSGIKSAGFVAAGVNAKIPAQSTAVVEQYSYVGLATPPEATRIRVAHFFCVDPSNGAKKKIEKSVWEAACKDASNRLLFLSALCEKLEQQRQDRMRVQDATPAVQPLAAQPKSTTDNSGSTLVAANALSLDPMESETTREPRAEEESKEEKPVHVDPTPTHTAPVPAKEQTPPVEPESTTTTSEVETVEEVTKAQLGVIRPVFALMGRTDWKMGKVVQGCLYEDCVVTYSKIKATRITTDMKCSVETFEAFLKDEAMVRKNDPSIDKMDILEDTGDTKTIYTSYKRISRLLTPRDFCAVGIHCHVTPDYAKKTFGVNLPAVAYVNALSNSERAPTKKDYVRGIIHNFGYIVCPDTAAGGKGQGIKVTQVGCVDPGGKIPNWILEAAKEESCKKLAGLRDLVEKYTPQ